MTGLSQERLDEIRERLPLPNTNLSQNMEYAHPGSGEWMANAQRDLTALLDEVERLRKIEEAATIYVNAEDEDDAAVEGIMAERSGAFNEQQVTRHRADLAFRELVQIIRTVKRVRP